MSSGPVVYGKDWRVTLPDGWRNLGPAGDAELLATGPAVVEGAMPTMMLTPAPGTVVDEAFVDATVTLLDRLAPGVGFVDSDLVEGERWDVLYQEYGPDLRSRTVRQRVLQRPGGAVVLTLVSESPDYPRMEHEFEAVCASLEVTG